MSPETLLNAMTKSYVKYLELKEELASLKRQLADCREMMEEEGGYY